MAKRVTVSDDTMDTLEPLAKPFESVDDCLKRILKKNCVQTQEKDDVVEEES